WLQELPDPISKVTWGNYAAVAPSLAAKLDLHEGDVVRLRNEAGQLELPIFIQPGQKPRTISVALGYGRRQVRRAGQGVGVNAFPFTQIRHGHRALNATDAILERTGRTEKLASTQTHFSMEGRPIVLKTSLEDLHSNSEAHAGAETFPTLWAERLQ